MHHRRPWIAFVMALFSMSASAVVIYKWTDADGVVHFSDQAVPGAEKIVTGGPTSRGIDGGPKTQATRPIPVRPESRGLAGTQLSIDSPQPEENFTGDVAVPVHLNVAPAMSESQSIAWRLNGKVLTDPGADSPSFTLSSLGRGTYTLSATITDQSTGESLSSDPVTFYIRKPSALLPQNKAR